MNKLYMTVGLPGSGKSTWAKKMGIPVFSSDSIREELYGDENVQKDNNKVFMLLHKRIKEQLKIGDAIYDATNLSAKRRAGFISQIFGVEKIAVLFATDFKTILEQNEKRERKVPKYVIERMRESFQIPMYWEGWDKIEIIWNDDNFFFPWAELDMDQENPNHTLTLKNHLQKTADLLVREMDTALLLAGMLHDIGKIYTKKFENGKGEKTEHAHYFNHHNVSAYEAMFVLKKDYGVKHVKNIVEIVGLINWHMQPYFLKTEKSINKWIGYQQEKLELWNKIIILNRADKKAH